MSFSKENDQYIQLVQKHFGNKREAPYATTLGLLFLNAMRIARATDPEAFHTLWSSVQGEEQINYFHKGFRQVDVFKTASGSLDFLCYGLLDLFQDLEWQRFNELMKAVVSYNTNTPEDNSIPDLA
ncbi:hypothetical protein CLV58_109231 [Spirosoma oryzae]|uniref:Uncharacterized protein n=1 Tax=Spirosoma oryzae TaxID=1469603 RepID=A0A2T0SYM4_9BACT|nr:hypothetical protein [Spirosoma oryzae]PRY38504.1 hypothetical protein CLV58_109231 [Spirosoma oryzae]